MINKIAKVLDSVPRWFYIAFYALAVSFYSFVNGLQGDTLFHIKIGEYISKFGIPTIDPFSWTTIGKPWFAHEWLWDLIVYQLFNFVGYSGLFIVHSLSVLLLVFCVFSFVKDKFLIFLCFILFINTTLTVDLFPIRPQTLVYALYAFLLLMISKSEKIKPLLLGSIFFALFIFWTNIHSSVIFGLGMVAIFLFFKKVTWNIFIISFLASLFNPHKWKLFLYAYQINSLSITVDRITEWFSPNFHALPLLFIFMFILLILVITVQNSQIEKSKYLILIVFFVTIALFLKSIRHLPFLFITAIFVGCDKKKIERWIQSVVVICIIVTTVLMQGFDIKGISAVNLSKDFPVEAVSFMKKNGFIDNILNDYYYGDYLLFMDVKTFVDGRGDLFALENPILWDDYFNLLGLKIEKPESILDKYKIKYILFPKHSICIKYLKKLPSITILYEDKKDVVLEYISGK